MHPSTNAQAGPSRKPRAAHPSTTTTSTLPSTRKLRPPPPTPLPNPSTRPPPTQPFKLLQGAGVRRTDTQRPGFGRADVFVTRKTSLGSLLARVRSLVMAEGHTHVRLHALAAAIPHALLLLHAVLDVLPFPTGRGGMWYEITTGSVECVDEVDADNTIDEDGGDEFAGLLGAVEEDEPTRRVRTKASMTVDIHVAPRGKTTPGAEVPQRSGVGKGAKGRGGKAPGKPKTRMSAKKRRAVRAKAKETAAAGAGGAGAGVAGSARGEVVYDEEDAMNAGGYDDEEDMMNR